MGHWDKSDDKMDDLIARTIEIESRIPASMHDETVAIFEAAAQEALHLPESLQISERAMDRLRHTFANGYEFNFNGTGEELEGDTGMNAYRLFSQSLQSFDLLMANRILAVVKEGKLAGVTAYQVGESEGVRMAHILQQESQGFPGVGLAMLDRIIERVREEEVSEVYLETKWLPRGLGNLGFEYLNSDQMVPKYRAVLQERHEDPS